ncbi:transporter protein [Fictibacillus macauensis ZFHKF-1]|uniref:Bcr/CflA family efflux transporter n=1 Tax=Fictibacillus macauensis ZFHKF-1 TaxID=1196324 RepID=I8AEF4_9BACL|nr:multidrug effflux MFS transporter [Fictibacillus macauensis]EIT83709.1 transporter protein [Fictibacillus macauensis ZFHKF-1]
MTKSTHAFLQLLTLIALVCIPQLSISLYLPALPSMATYFHASSSDMQLTLSIYMIGYAASALICGVFSDQFGKKKVVIAGLLLYAVGSLTCLLTSTVYVLIVGRFLQALGGGCGTVIARVIAKDAFQEKKQLAVLTYLSTAIAVTPAIAPTIGSLLQSQWGFKACFLFLVSLTIPVLLLALFVLPREERAEQSLSARSLVKSYRYLLTQKVFLAYSVTIGLAWCAYYTFIQTSSFVLQDLLHVGPTAYSLLYALVIFGYIIGTTYTRKKGLYVGLDAVIMKQSVVALCASLLMLVLTLVFPQSPFVIIGGMMVVMIGIGGIFPACQSAVMEPFREQVGVASGLFFFIQMMFGSVCGLLLGSFQLHSSLGMVGMIASCCVLLVIGFYFMISKENKASNRQHSSFLH